MKLRAITDPEDPPMIVITIQHPREGLYHSEGGKFIPVVSWNYDVLISDDAKGDTERRFSRGLAWLDGDSISIDDLLDDAFSETRTLMGEQGQ